MKLRTATPVSLSSLLVKGLAIGISIAVLVGGFLYFSKPASADQFDAKIQQLQQDIVEYQAEASRLNAESVTLANTLAQLNNERRALQAQIDMNEARHTQLVIQIDETEKEIKETQDALGVTLADLFVDDGISPIEMLASSRNINDYLDKQEYRNSIRDELGSTIKRVKQLKQDLTDKRDEVTKVLNEQKVARQTLIERENEQQSLLAQTKNDEANYQNLIKDSRAKIEEARAQQIIMNNRANQGGGSKVLGAGRNSAYENIWGNKDCIVGADAMSYQGANGNGGDGYGYGCRQCASYAAWRFRLATGRTDVNLGNGGSFAYNAIRAGYKNLGRSPQPGSLAVMWGINSPPYATNARPGHVAWVESVSDDGSRVVVSQYNWNYGTGWGMYSVMDLPTSTFDQYVKITQ